MSKEILNPSKDNAQTFLRILDPTATNFTFQTFDDNSDRKKSSLTRVLNGSLDEHWLTLADLNRQGAGIFITVNTTNLTGRKREDITHIRAIWQEDDEGTMMDFPIEPHMVVESSPRKHHRYFLTDSDKVDEFESVQSRMVKDYGSDHNAKDRSRVLRLPGFYHQKVNKKKNQNGSPHMVHIESSSSEPRIEWETLKKYFPPVKSEQREINTLEQTNPVCIGKEALDHLRQALQHLARSEVDAAESLSGDRTYADHRAAWIGIAHDLRSLGAKGFNLFDEFSQYSDKYGAADTLERWRGIKNPKSNYRNIFRKAQDSGWKNPIVKAPNQYPLNMDPVKTTIDCNNPLNWTKDFTLSDAEIEAISDPEWIIENMLIRGHVVAIAAEPNGGKTTILLHLAGEIVDSGYEVYYVNSDTSGGDAKPMHRLAKERGFTLMLPDMASGSLSMDDVVHHLNALNETSANLSNVVFIFDTLKKMVEVIQKSKIKILLKLLRALSAQGMTIVLLGHTNKYKDPEGKPIFEGTVDLRADVDELIYFIPEKQPNGNMIVTTDPDKVRGAFEPITFKISEDRSVTLLDDVVDTRAHRATMVRMKKNKAEIEAIDLAIEDGCTSQKDILSHCDTNSGLKNHSVLRALKAYSVEAHIENTSLMRSRPEGLMWSRAKSGTNNHLAYRKLPTEEESEICNGFDSDKAEF